MDHLRDHSFRVKPVVVEDTGIVRRRHGIPDALGGCHTAVVAGYAIEGHVPAREIKRLLAEKPRPRPRGTGHAGGLTRHGIAGSPRPV